MESTKDTFLKNVCRNSEEELSHDQAADLKLAVKKKRKERKKEKTRNILCCYGC